MSLVLCNLGSAPRSNRSNASSDQNTITSSSAANASARSSSANAGMPMSSSASALNRMHGAIHHSPSSSTLNQASIANDNNNNSKNSYSETDDVNQVTIYRYGVHHQALNIQHFRSMIKQIKPQNIKPKKKYNFDLNQKM